MSDSPSRRPPAWVWFLLAPILALGLAFVAFTLLLPPARVRALVEQQLASALRREVRFAGVSLSLFPPVRLSLREFQLAEPGGLANGAALAVRSVDLDLDPFALLSNRLAVRRLTLVEPRVHLLLRADGSTNFDSLGAPAKPGAPAPAMDFDVRAFEVRGGKLLVDDMKGAKRVAADLGTRLSLTTSAGGSRVATRGVTEVANLMWGPLSASRLADLNGSLAKLRARLEHDGVWDAPSRRLALSTLALDLGRARIAMVGVIDDPGPRARVDVKANGDGVEFGEVLGWLAAADARLVSGIRGSGRLTFALAARGALGGAAPPPVTGTLAIRDGAFRYAGAPADVSGLSVDARFAPDSAIVTALSAIVAGQPVRGRVTATRFTDPLVDFAVQGNLDLAAVAPMVAPKDVQLAGRAAVDVRGRGRARDAGSLALAGAATLANVRVASPGLPKPVEGVNGRITFAPERASITGLTAKAGGSSFTLDASVTRPLALMADRTKVAPAGVRFDFRSPNLDLAELLPTTPGAPFLPNATGGGRVAIAHLRQGRLDVRAVNAEVTLAPAQLDAPAFSMQGYGGTVKGSARFDLRDTAKPAYAIKAAVDQVQANDLLSAWTPARNFVTGSLSSSIDFSGRGQQPDDLKRTLTLIGLAAFTEGQLGPGPILAAIADAVRIPAIKDLRFKDLKLPMRIEQGRVISDPIVIQGPSGEWRLAGSVGFDGTLDYAVSATLPAEVQQRLQAASALAAGALKDEQGRILIDLRLGGSLKSPKVAWDSRSMRDRLAGRASAALEEQRAKLENEARAMADARIRAAQDSARAAAERLRRAAEDSLRSRAGGLLNRFFGGAKPPATPSTPPATPVETPPAAQPSTPTPAAPPPTTPAAADSDTTARQ